MKNPSKQYAAFVSKVEPSSTLNLPDEFQLKGTVAKIGDYLRAWEAAVYLGISESTLAKLRMRNNRSRGPNYIKSNGIVIYRRDDLDAWLESQIVEGEA